MMRGLSNKLINTDASLLVIASVKHINYATTLDTMGFTLNAAVPCYGIAPRSNCACCGWINLRTSHCFAMAWSSRFYGCGAWWLLSLSGQCCGGAQPRL
jgi:hypothetical protein